MKKLLVAYAILVHGVVVFVAISCLSLSGQLESRNERDSRIVEQYREKTVVIATEFGLDKDVRSVEDILDVWQTLAFDIQPTPE